jgi:FixJ family two-component response regulator
MTSKSPIVAVIDDDEAVRDSLRWLLEGNGFNVLAFNSGESFLAGWPKEKTGCIILDIRMPGMTGVELHDEIARDPNAPPVIFITGHGDVPMAVSRLKAGAIDFLEKPFSQEELCGLVTQALAKFESMRVAQGESKSRDEKLARLTGREAQVLERIVAGRLNKQIADDLNISIKTVEAHRANIMDKLGARTMADLMKIAIGT